MQTILMDKSLKNSQKKRFWVSISDSVTLDFAFVYCAHVLCSVLSFTSLLLCVLRWPRCVSSSDLFCVVWFLTKGVLCSRLHRLSIPLLGARIPPHQMMAARAFLLVTTTTVIRKHQALLTRRLFVLRGPFPSCLILSRRLGISSLIQRYLLPRGDKRVRQHLPITRFNLQTHRQCTVVLRVLL